MVAAGSIVKRQPSLAAVGSLQKVVIAWVADASGNVNGNLTGVVSGMLRRATFAPGTPAPTTLYDAVLLDDTGYDVLAGAGANITVSGSTPINITPAVPVAILSTLELQISNAGNIKQGTLTLLLSKN